MAKRKEEFPDLESPRNMVEPITPSKGRKKSSKSMESADQEYIQRLRERDKMDNGK